jgi:general secretion pathway protein D
MRLAWLAVLALAACGHSEATSAPANLVPLPQVSAGIGAATPRVNGSAGAPKRMATAQFAYARGVAPQAPGHEITYEGPNEVSLEFADADIREVVGQILGNVLHVDYTIDPAVHGTATLHSAQPMSRDQLLPTLQSLLAQNGAALLRAGRLYRVVPAKDAATAPGIANSAFAQGSEVVPLRYLSAEELAKTLQPYVANGGKIVASAGANAVIVTGDPPTRDTLVDLVHAFDVDLLAGQSYAMLPVPNGDAKDFATGLQDALRAQKDEALRATVRVVPMARLGAVLVVANQPRLLDGVARVYRLIEKKQRENVRSWHVYYLQNSRAGSVAYVLQQAFTPNNVTAQPQGTAPGNTNGLPGVQQAATGFPTTPGTAGGIGTGGIGGTTGIGTTGVPGMPGQTGTFGPGTVTPGSTIGTATPTPAISAAPGNPLLGGLETGGAAGANAAEAEAMRIIPEPQNNAILIYGTEQEEDAVEAMLHKVDILPLQVRIDATIAEVDLNDQLQYGTQFFFKAGGLNGTLTQAFPTGSAGFLLAGSSASQVAIAALQSVTTVRVLSSPQLLVLDNQPALLQVGDAVPYLTATSQSTLVAGSPVVNSINYMQTGVIMQVTPRVNSGGLVTLDIMQQVSDVDTSVNTAGIQSPAFLERNVASRVVVQDGQTLGLAGLIRDNSTRNNQGFPWIKDVPLIGALFGQQNNTRARTELLVLITPHVIYNQRNARALSEDLREQLPNAALVPAILNNLKPSGSSDPNQQLRHRLGLEP